MQLWQDLQMDAQRTHLNGGIAPLQHQPTHQQQAAFMSQQQQTLSQLVSSQPLFHQQPDEKSTNSVDDHQQLRQEFPREPSIMKSDSLGMIDDPFRMVLVDGTQAASSLFLSPPTTDIMDQVFPFEYGHTQVAPPQPHHQMTGFHQQPLKFFEAQSMPCDLLISPEQVDSVHSSMNGKRKRSDSCPEEPQLKRAKSQPASKKIPAPPQPNQQDCGNGQLFFLPDPNRVVTLNDQRKNKLRINKQFSKFFPLENNDIFVNGNRARFIKSDCSIRFKKIDYRMMGLRAGVRAQFKKIGPLTFTIEAVHFIREMKEKKKKKAKSKQSSKPSAASSKPKAASSTPPNPHQPTSSTAPKK